MGFKLLNGEEFYALGSVTFDLLTSKSIGIIYGSWPSLIPGKVYLVKISLQSMRGQYSRTGRIDRHT